MYEDLIRALRCTKNENDDCRTCKYLVLREGLYDYCDQEQLEIDAAEAIKSLHEQLSRVTAERDAAIKRTKRLCYLEYNGWCDNDEEPCDGCVGKWRSPQKEG